MSTTTQKKVTKPAATKAASKTAKAAPKAAKAAPKMQAMKVAYYILYVPEMAKAADFYKMIGLNMGFQSPDWTEFDAGIKFALHATEAKDYKPAMTNISFGVENCKATYEHFKSLGITLKNEPHQVCENNYSFCFNDPFGNTLSIYGG
jgi:predicted enzyme related to lactoylglutathione lyase